MNVIDTPLQIGFVANGVFPISLLPDSAMAFLFSGGRLAQFGAASPEPRFREFFLNSHPARWVPIISWRECPDRVPMIWKKHNGDDLERMIAFDGVDRRAEAATSQVSREHPPAAVSDAREEIRSAGHIRSPIVRHEAGPKFVESGNANSAGLSYPTDHGIL